MQNENIGVQSKRTATVAAVAGAIAPFFSFWRDRDFATASRRRSTQKADGVSMNATNATTLKERLLDKARADAPDGDARTFFSADGSIAIFADSFDEGKGAEVFAEFPRAKKSALATPFEFYLDGRRTFAGELAAELWVDDKRLAAVGAWETVCEETQDDYSFLERTIATTGGRLFSRRLLAARNEALFLIADSLFASVADRRRSDAPLLRYRSTLPLDSETVASQDSEAREILLTTPRSDDSQPLARVFPLALSEWRADVASGEFRVENDAATPTLTTTAIRRGRALFAATLIDGNARRAKRPCSWRPLTVGESLRPVDDDAAVGRDIQLGRERFVLYASTSERPAIRSILGRNLLSDFMFGKFFVDRGVEPIVDVETLDE